MGVLGRQGGVVEGWRLRSSPPSSPYNVDGAPQLNIAIVVVFEEEGAGVLSLITLTTYSVLIINILPSSHFFFHESLHNGTQVPHVSCHHLNNTEWAAHTGRFNQMNPIVVCVDMLSCPLPLLYETEVSISVHHRVSRHEELVHYLVQHSNLNHVQPQTHHLRVLVLTLPESDQTINFLLLPSIVGRAFSRHDPISSICPIVLINVYMYCCIPVLAGTTNE